MPSEPGVDPCAGEMPMPPRLLSAARESAVLRTQSSRRCRARNAATHRLRALRAAPAAPGVADVPPAAASCSRASSCASLALTWPRGVPVVVVCRGVQRPRQHARVRHAPPRSTCHVVAVPAPHRDEVLCGATAGASALARAHAHTAARWCVAGSAAGPTTHAEARAAACLQVSPGSSTVPQKSHVLGWGAVRREPSAISRRTQAAHAPAPEARSALRPQPRGCALP